MLSLFCGMTKEIMSRGPQVVDMECQETTCQKYPFAQMETLLTTTEVVEFQMASTTPTGFLKAMGLAP
jgi:hypothetical protein